VLLTALVALAGATELVACQRQAWREAAMLTGGDPGRGQAAIEAYGCGSCHTIPGIPGANTLVGPPLSGIASRAYVAGVLPNTPNNMIRWIEHPQAIDPLTAMPDLGVPDPTARDIAAYLYTLR
jgi:cytochrome c2